MKATYFMGHETFEVRECPIPKAKPGTVVVKNYACGVCGTDVHIYHGEKGSAAVNPPVVLGHEYSGVVTEVGEGVKGLKIGDHVTIDPNIYCGECEYCRNGKKQMCRHMEAVGVTMNGGFEEYSIVPAAQALLLDPNVPLEYGAMSEPLACCLHGIDRAEIKVGDIVCVVGGGAIGLLLVQLARLAGAAKVVLSEPNEARRKVARSSARICALTRSKTAITKNSSRSSAATAQTSSLSARATTPLWKAPSSLQDAARRSCSSACRRWKRPTKCRFSTSTRKSSPSRARSSTRIRTCAP